MRYELRCGKFGTYFYDTKEEKDLGNKDVLAILNSDEYKNSIKKVRLCNINTTCGFEFELDCPHCQQNIQLSKYPSIGDIVKCNYYCGKEIEISE